MKSLLRAAVLLGVLFLSIGCKSDPVVLPVMGVATRGGQPIKHLSLTFFPADNSRPSLGVTDEEGRFELKFDRKTKGVSVGTHKVVAAFRPRSPKEEADFAAGTITFHADQDAILEKYGKRDTTKMEVTITKAESDLQLKFD